MAGKLLLLRTREYNRVQQSCMGWPNEYNIIQHRGKQKKRCIVQHLFNEKFDRDQTSYNKTQHDKTRYNKVAKRVQHFIKHQSCMMLYEMLYSFGRGFRVLVQSICRLLHFQQNVFLVSELIFVSFFLEDIRVSLELFQSRFDRCCAVFY